MTSPAVQLFEKQEIQRLTEGKDIPEFFSGDVLLLKLKTADRISSYEGVCVGRRNRGLGSSFTVEKTSFGERVRRVFPLYSPSILSITVLKRGKVRRAKLNYLQYRSSKEARISEAKHGYKGKLSSKFSGKNAKNSKKK